MAATHSPESQPRTASWLEELKRRRVFRALIGYGVVAFAVLQVIEPVMHGLGLPDWVLSATVLAVGAGFPLTLIVAWAYDLRGRRLERAGAPRPALLLALIVAGTAIAAPGVAWTLWRARRAPPAAQPSIAVLPFADLSPARDQDWMCDGIAEEILDTLSTVPGLRVAARSASFQFKGRPAGVRQMADMLGVSTLLEGSVRKIDDRLRVSARLVSSDGYELWSDRFDRAVSDAFAMQDEIARAVASSLRLQMRAGRPSGTQNPQAWEMYLRGRQYFRGLGATNGEFAREMFKRAIALDPRFAQAHAGLADVGSNLVQWQLLASAEVESVRRETLAESEEALRLDPTLSEAHVARGNVLSAVGRDAEADRSFRRALELGPGSRDAHYYYGRFLFAQKRYADAARAFEHAAEINPDDFDALTLLAMQYLRLGATAKARDASRRSIEAADRVLRDNPDDVRALYLSGTDLVRVGDTTRGLDRLERGVMLHQGDFATLYNAACGYAIAGNATRALELLEQAVGTGKGYRPWFEQDPDFDSLRALPRFREIVARLPR